MLPGTHVVPRCVTQQGHGCPVACWRCPGMGTRAASLAGVDARWAGHPTLSPMASAPGSRHTPGRVGWRVGRALAAGGRFCSPPLQGALFGASMEGLRGAPLPRLGRAVPGDCGRAVRAHVGAQCVPARTRAACGWQPDMGGSGGAASLPRGPAGPGVRSRSGATCAHACAHAGHLLKRKGGFSAALAGVEGCVWTVSAWSVPGAHGSAVCEKPFAFLGHVTTACAGWRLAARAASDVGRWPRGGRAGLWQRIWWGFVTGCCRWLGCLWSWWHRAGTWLCGWESSRQGNYFGLISPLLVSEPRRVCGEGAGLWSLHQAPVGRSGAARLSSLSPSPGCPLVTLTGEAQRPVSQQGSLPAAQTAADAGVGRGAVLAPLCRSLAAVPPQGLPGCSSSLVTRPCFDPSSLQEAGILQIWSVLETKWIRSWHCGRLALRPAAARQRCSSLGHAAAFLAASGSSQHL